MTTAGEPPIPGQRWRWPGTALRELHFRLRSEGDTAARRGAAVALGTFIGCLPLYGAHLLLCTVTARLLRLNRLLTYLAAQISNPLTAPLLLALSYGLGHRLTQGDWPGFDAAQMANLGPWGLSRDLMSGGVALGAMLGVVLGGAAWGMGSSRDRAGRAGPLFEAILRRYEPSGVFHWEFVRGKLRHDPMYEALAERAELFGKGTVLDLGCGRGIALALAAAARAPVDASAAVGRGELIGVDVRPGAAAVARAALGSAARIDLVDLARYRPPAADLVLLLDVLHYLAGGEQERLLGELAAHLRPGGVILVREADAAAGARFWLTRASERARALGRGAIEQRFCYRSGADWLRLLSAHGLEVERVPMRDGTPFANVMIEARRRP